MMFNMSVLSYRKNKKNADPKYQESLAHVVKDIILGADHSTHPKSRKKAKKAVKALQNNTAAQGMINVLKAMPDPVIPPIEVTVVEEEQETTSTNPSKSPDNNKKEPTSKKIK